MCQAGRPSLPLGCLQVLRRGCWAWQQQQQQCCLDQFADQPTATLPMPTDAASTKDLVALQYSTAVSRPGGVGVFDSVTCYPSVG
jgi:hypothetical protein